MKKLRFLALSLVVAALFSACNKDDIIFHRNVEPGTPFNLEVNHIADLESDDFHITFMGITEDSRCPNGVECIWEGRAVAEFKVKFEGTTLYKTLTDNPAKDPNFSDYFNAFGHSVRLLQVMPYPEAGIPIDEDDYAVKLVIGPPIEEDGSR